MEKKFGVTAFNGKLKCLNNRCSCSWPTAPLGAHFFPQEQTFLSFSLLSTFDSQFCRFYPFLFFLDDSCMLIICQRFSVIFLPIVE